MKRRVNHSRVLRIPKILTQQRDFAEIDKFMRAIEQDAVTEIRDGDRWMIAQTTIEKESYCVLTALDGWCDCFSEIAANSICEVAKTYNDKALRSLISKMRLDQAISVNLFNAAKEVVETQRKLYMQAPHGIINNVASTMLDKAA